MTQSTRYDLLLVTEKPGQRLAPRAGEAFLRNLATARMMLPSAESIAREWVEVYGEAGPSAHELFVKGAYDGSTPVFQRAVVRFGLQSVELPFGRTGPENFFVLIEGALFDRVLGPIINRFKDITHFRATTFVRPSAGVGPVREVPEDELPIEKRRREIGKALAGTRVEEW